MTLNPAVLLPGPLHCKSACNGLFMDSNLSSADNYFLIILDCYLKLVSSVGIATRYGLDGPGIESRWEQDFLQPSRPALGPTQPPVQWVPSRPRRKSCRCMAFTTYSILAPKLKKEYSYTSTPPLGLGGLF
jgi:hypothetical protein